MSFIITVYTNEGIIMASDSRTTYTTTKISNGGMLEKHVGSQLTDSTNKTFLCEESGIGLSTCGDSSIDGMPIAGYIEDFISHETNADSTVQSISQGLLDYFGKYTPIPATDFIVSGYSKVDFKQYISRVFVASQEIIPIDTTVPGVLWDGETDIFKRLVKPVSLKRDDGSYEELPVYSTGYNFFTLQDAIDYAEYAVDVTIKTMFFQQRVKTVGGLIDILAIKPSGAFWVKRKELHA